MGEDLLEAKYLFKLLQRTNSLIHRAKAHGLILIELDREDTFCSRRRDIPFCTVTHIDRVLSIDLEMLESFFKESIYFRPSKSATRDQDVNIIRYAQLFQGPLLSVLGPFGDNNNLLPQLLQIPQQAHGTGLDD